MMLILELLAAWFLAGVATIAALNAAKTAIGRGWIL